jgi:hypothetical protein
MKTILTVVVSLLIIALAFTWYSGDFTRIKAEETVEGGYKVAGLEFTGSYSKAGKSISEVDKKLKDMGVNCSKGFGIYYDDPKITPQEKCRSFVGNILEEKDFYKIPELKLAGLKIDSIPKSKAVVAVFPAKTFLSYMIGPLKAYPVLSQYINENKYKVTFSLEVYDMPEKRITYMMLLHDK